MGSRSGDPTCVVCEARALSLTQLELRRTLASGRTSQQAALCPCERTRGRAMGAPTMRRPARWQPAWRGLATLITQSVLVLSAGCGGGAATAEVAPPPTNRPSEPPAVDGGAAAASDLPDSGTASPTSTPESALHVAFETTAPWLDVHVVGSAAILVEARKSPRQAIAPPYLLTDDGVRSAPELFAGLPIPSRDAPGRAKGMRIGEIHGSWPDLERLVGFEFSSLGPMIPYRWAQDRWQPRPRPRPAWYNDKRIDRFESHWRDDCWLYERYDPATGRGRFELSGCGAAPTPRRAIAPPGCRCIPTELPAPVDPDPPSQHHVCGPFRGAPLPTGELIGWGISCRTGKLAVERWPAGAAQSVVEELPNSGVFDYVQHEATSAQEIYLYGSIRSSRLLPLHVKPPPAPPRRAYVARFDGKKWTDLSPQSLESPTLLHRLANGETWLGAMGAPRRLTDAGWESYPRAPTSETFVGIAPGPAGEIWAGFRAPNIWRLDRTKRSWQELALPTFRADDREHRFARRRIYWRGAGKPLVHAAGPGRQAILTLEQPAAVVRSRPDG